MFHKSLSETNSKVHEIVKRFLILEEEAMQERIRFCILSIIYFTSFYIIFFDISSILFFCKSLQIIQSGPYFNIFVET